MQKDIRKSLMGAAMAGLLAGGAFYTQPSVAGSSKSPDKKSCGCTGEKGCECKDKKNCKCGKECKRSGKKDCKESCCKKGSGSEEKGGKGGCGAGGCKTEKKK